jgi:hypothetical protein
MKGKFSEDHKDILKVNRLLQSSLLEMRYHCEVYKLSLQCITKILSNATIQSIPINSVIQEPCLKYTARYNYQRNVALVSQKRALDKISLVLNKAKIFIKGYSYIENTNVPFMVMKPSTSSMVSESCDSNAESIGETGQLNRYFNLLSLIHLFTFMSSWKRSPSTAPLHAFFFAWE